MSALDDILQKRYSTPDVNEWERLIVPARAELGQLRARIDALENDIVCAFCGTHYKADDVPPQHYLTCEQSPLVQRIAEQAHQLEDAREIIRVGSTVYTGSATCNSAFNTRCREWLAANPAPQPEMPQDEAQ